MPNWILKSAVQQVIGCLPRSYRWNALLQRKLGRYLAPQTVFEGKLALCQRHLDYHKKFSTRPVDNFSALELGTGAWPIVPLGLFLCGAKEIWTYDLVPLAEPETFHHTLSQFAEAIRTETIHTLLPDAQPARIAQLAEIIANAKSDSPAVILERCNIHLLIGDARHTGLPTGSVDFIFSTVVFEHIPAKVIKGLFAEFHRLLAPGGIMSHYIGLEDQYSSVDRSLTPFNHLRYTARQWRWLNNPITSQTRLRIADYRTLHRQGNFTVLSEENVLGQPEDLRSITLAPEFRHHSFEDLLVRYSWLVAKPADAIQ